MSPGPNTTLGIPPADNTAASQKKSTPTGPHLADAPQKLPDQRQLWVRFQRQRRRQLRAGNFRRQFLSRAASAAISRRTPASVSPGNVRRSIVIAQLSGTMFGCVPPEIVPTFTVARAEQRMFSFPQPRRVIRFKHVRRCAPFRGRHFCRAAASRRAPPCRAFRVAATSCPCAR